MLKKTEKIRRRAMRSQVLFKKARRVAFKEIRTDLQACIDQPSTQNLLRFEKTLISNGIWVSRGYLRYLLSHFKNQPDGPFEDDEIHSDIITAIREKHHNHLKSYSSEEIFYAIFREREFYHTHPDYRPKISCPKVKPTIVLVSGMFNELFSTAAFERAAEHLEHQSKLKYFAPKVSGTKGSHHNTQQLKVQMEKYVAENPDERLWFFTFSKGGVDTLHFFKEYPEFAKKHVIGLSTVATPILGTNRLDHRLLRLTSKVDEIYDKTMGIDRNKKRPDFFMRELQKSLSHRYQKHWFQRNNNKLPTNIFYSSLALRSEWYESHIWMILTKLFFKSKTINDGIVDIDNAHFPDYFDSLNFGILGGHHLVGSRSSFYSQEAVLEAHIIYLNFLGYL